MKHLVYRAPSIAFFSDHLSSRYLGSMGNIHPMAAHKGLELLTKLGSPVHPVMSAPFIGSKNSIFLPYPHFNEQKNSGLTHFSHFKTPDMAVKELWVYLLAHHLIRMVMAQSALLADCLPRQLSFKHSLQLCLAMCQCQYDADAQGDGAQDLLKLITRKRMGNRSGRIEPRAIKRSPSLIRC